MEEKNIINKIEIVGIGFINFFIKEEYLLEGINKIIELDEDYGKNNVGNGQKINIEYVSANPTGILHVGTARGAAYGDSISRIMSFSGYDITREYYVNDGGNQIKNLGLSIKARYSKLCGIPMEMPEDGYYGNEIIEIAQKIYEENKDSKINSDTEYFSKLGVEELLLRIKRDLKNFRVEFDVWTSEARIRESGKIEKCIELLKNTDNIYEKDNATWIKTTKYGDDKDRVIIKSDKTYTYVAPDIAYHLDKIERGYTKLIDVLGADHHGYKTRLKASVEALGLDSSKIDVKLLQMVKLIKNGEEVKMSKRTGQTITIEELLEEVGIDASRYFFAARSLDTQINFDITLATKESNENPVYYIQYAHARICSIISSIEEMFKVEKYNNLTSNYAISLLKKVYEFNEVVELAAAKQLPHIITNYVYELSTLFHTYYTNEKVITEDKIITNERINLIKTVKITIRNALKLIGVEALEKM